MPTITTIAPGHWLDTAPAASYLRMLAAGCPAGITDAGRTYAEQVVLFKDRYTTNYYASARNVHHTWAGNVWWRIGAADAAVPGTSKHETGRALDLPAAAAEWVRANGAAYGWIAGLVPGEWWHMEYVADRDTKGQTPAPTPPEDDMFNDADRALLVEAVTTARRLEIKARRRDLIFLYGATPDGRPFVALPQDGAWMIAPSIEVRDQHRWLMTQLGLVVEGTSATDWDDVRVKTLGLAENGDVIADPEGLGDLRQWKSYPGGKFPA